MKILLIDDDLAIHALIKKCLNSLVSLECSVALPPPDRMETFDLILLDLMLEEQNSLEALKLLHDERPHLLGRIILLTGAGSVDHEIETHRLGIRDFVKKPFHPKVLLALVDKHLTQLRSFGGIKFGPFLLDLSNFAIYNVPDNVKLELTKTEFDVLRILIESRGRVLTRERLMAEIWNMDDDTQTRTIDMHMNSLRKKMHPFGDLLKTKRGIGYFLSETE